MSNSSRNWTGILAGLAALGGAAWVVKFLIILADDGGDAGGLAAVLYLLGVGFMVVGSAFLAVHLARGRGRLVLAAGLVAAPFVVFLSYALLDGLAKAVVGDSGPGWLEDEAGILVTGLFWLAAGLWGRRSGRREGRGAASLASGAA
jgi:hypothetical protein